jgi:hypothetical protein
MPIFIIGIMTGLAPAPPPIKTLRFSKAANGPVRQATPDCKTCLDRFPNKFEQCAIRVVMVYLRCHGPIHS